MLFELITGPRSGWAQAERPEPGTLLLYDCHH